MIIQVRVDEQSLRWYDRAPQIAENSVKFVRFQFTFSPDWEGYEITAQFTQGSTYSVLLTKGYCEMPAELVAGDCSVSVFGYKSGQPDRATTIPLAFQIHKSGFETDAKPPVPPTPDLYSQLLQKFNEGPDGAILYTPQVLTPEQQEQAKLNLGLGETPDWDQLDAEGSGYIKNKPMYRRNTHSTKVEVLEVGSHCVFDFTTWPGSVRKSYLSLEQIDNPISQFAYHYNYQRKSATGWTSVSMKLGNATPIDELNWYRQVSPYAKLYVVQDRTKLPEELQNPITHNGVWLVVTDERAKDSMKEFAFVEYMYTKLDSNYLPDVTGTVRTINGKKPDLAGNITVPEQVMLVNVSTTYSDSGEITYSADKTIDEMLEAIQAGVHIVCMYGRQECSLNSYSTNKRYISFVFHAGGRTNSLMCAADEWTLNPIFDAANASMFPIEAKPGQVLVVDTLGPGGIAKLKTINMPTGGGEKWETIIDYTVPEDCAEVFLKTDINGNPFKLKRAIVTLLLFPAAGLTSEEWPVYTVDGTVDNVYGSNHYRYGAGYIPYETGMYRLTKFEVVQMPDGVHLLTVRETKTPAAYDEDGDVNASLVMAGGGFNERFHAKNLAPVVTEISAVGIGYYMTAIGAGTRIIMQGVRE